MKKIFCIAFLSVAATGLAADVHDLEFGVRAGTSINNRTDTFRQVEGTINYRLPWRWDIGGNFHVQSRLDFSAGCLHGEGENAAIGTLGPSVILRWKDFPVTLDVGSSPTLLSDHRFAHRDFGCDFQFTSHIGLNWEILPNFSVGYRYQHMSNAGLGSPNPGLNLHALGITCRF